MKTVTLNAIELSSAYKKLGLGGLSQRNASSHFISQSKSQAGFSLIELMIASLIGLITIAGILSVFVASGNHYKLSQAQADVQQNGQFVLRRIKRDIQRAGFNLDWEHASPAVKWLLNDSVNYPANARNILEIYQRNSQTNNIDRHSYYLVDDLLKLRLSADVFGSATLTTLEIAENIASIKYRFASNIHNEQSLADIDWLPRPISGSPSAAYIDQTEYSAMVAAGDVSWHQIKAISVEIISASSTRFITDSAQKLTFFDFDSAASSALPSTLNAQDLRFYRGFKSTIALKNRIK